MKIKNQTIVLFIIFAMVGIGLIAGGGVALAKDIVFKQSAVETEATITRITSSRNSDGDTTHTAYVVYTYNNVVFPATSLSYYSSNMRVGDTVTIFVDSNNPYNIKHEKSATIMCSILFGIGALFAAIGISGIIGHSRGKAKRKNLMANGKKISATIVDVRRGNITVNGRPSYRVICEHTDERGVLHTFKSDNIWLDTLNLTGCTISVYISTTNPSKYYVDILSTTLPTDPIQRQTIIQNSVAPPRFAPNPAADYSNGFAASPAASCNCNSQNSLNGNDYSEQNKSGDYKASDSDKREICPDCGGLVDRNAKYCQNCGYPLSFIDNDQFDGNF